MLSRVWQTWEVVCKARNGTWKSGSEQNTSDKSAENGGFRSGGLQATSRESTGGNKVIYYMGRCTMRLLLSLLEAGQRTKLLRITRTMSESLITDGLTCVFIIVTGTRCPRTPTQLSGPSAHWRPGCAESSTRDLGVHGEPALHVLVQVLGRLRFWDVDCLVFSLVSWRSCKKKKAAWERFETVHNQNDSITKDIKR